MFERKFEIIKGGIDTPPDIDRRTFVSAFATNTRLMGVFGMYIEWQIESFGVHSSLHQFFYFDAEEYGFETYTEVVNADVFELRKIERGMMSGLGGNRVDLSEREARFIVQHYISFNEEKGLSLPVSYSLYSFLDEPSIRLSADEEHALFAKLCVKLSGPFEAINYFLMRTFAKDKYAAEFLTSEAFEGNSFDSPGTLASLCKNTIDVSASPTGGITYICESLLDDEVSKQYMMVISEIKIDDDFKIKSFHISSSFFISPIEAAMQMLRSEFITVYKTFFDTSYFEERCERLLETSVPTAYENGTLYMLFNKDNLHVRKSVFNLNDDISGLLYLPTNSDRMIVCSPTLEGIQKIENKLRTSPLGISTFPVSKYEFKEPVFHDFLNSEFDDFEAFIAETREFER